MQKRIAKILLPTDFSPNAKRAVEYGLGLAQKCGAEVILFHAFHFPMTTSEDMVYISKMKEEEVNKLEAERDILAENFPGINISAVAEYGSVVDLIEGLVAQEKVDLVVMGTKGETSSIDAVLGSVASNTINNVKCATLVIPEEVREFALNEIVLATDFHAVEDISCFDPLKHLLELTAASLAIVNVKKELDFAEVPSRPEIQIDQLFTKYKHSHHFLESENTEEALFDFINLHNADMIVMLTKHYNLWQRLWHKSLTKKMVLHSNIPVLILHEDN